MRELQNVKNNPELLPRGQFNNQNRDPRGAVGGRTKDFEWIRDGLDALRSKNPELLEVCEKINCPGLRDPKKCTPAHEWTALKLLFLAKYVPFYTKVVGERYFLSRGNPMLFIDLFAGCGLNRLTEDLYFPGSTLIAARLAKIRFTKIVAVELDPVKVKALRARLRLLGLQDLVDVLRGDCNKMTKGIEERYLVPGSHHLLFVDPPGYQIYWRSLEPLLAHPGDLIMLLQTRYIWKDIHKSPPPEALDRFFGTPDWRAQISREDDVVRFYLGRIGRFGGANVRRTVGEAIAINLGRQDLYYHILFAVRKTSEGTKWIDYVRAIKAKIERATVEWVRKAVDALQGNVKSLDEFLEEESYGGDLTEYF